jgi:hypothetical protein
MACPLVGGVAALLIEAHPTWGPMAVRTSILSTADQAAAPDNDRGWGLVDAWTAITAPSSIAVLDGESFAPDRLGTPARPVPEPPAQPAPFASPNPVAQGTWLHLGRPVREPTVIEIVDVNGRTLRRLAAPAGGGPVFWDGRGARGQRLGPGIYFAVWPFSQRTAVKIAVR